MDLIYDIVKYCTQFKIAVLRIMLLEKLLFEFLMSKTFDETLCDFP